MSVWMRYNWCRFVEAIECEVIAENSEFFRLFYDYEKQRKINDENTASTILNQSSSLFLSNQLVLSWYFVVFHPLGCLLSDWLGDFCVEVRWFQESTTAFSVYSHSVQIFGFDIHEQRNTRDFSQSVCACVCCVRVWFECVCLIQIAASHTICLTVNNSQFYSRFLFHLSLCFELCFVTNKHFGGFWK